MASPSDTYSPPERAESSLDSLTGMIPTEPNDLYNFTADPNLTIDYERLVGILESESVKVYMPSNQLNLEGGVGAVGRQRR